MLARRVNRRVVKLEGHPDHPRNYGTLCPKGQAQIMAVYDPNRVKAPLVHTKKKGVPGQCLQCAPLPLLLRRGRRKVQHLDPALRAAYNYQYATKDLGAFAHNGKYLIQVLYDTLADIGQQVSVDMSGMTRP